MSRPEANIDWKEVDRLLEAGCIGTEIAGKFGIHQNTLYRRCEEEHNISFSEYLHQKRSCGDALLRTKQFEVAMEGDKTMLVWLGKCRLGQQEINNQATEREKNQHVIVDFVHEMIMEKTNAKSKTD